LYFKLGTHTYTKVQPNFISERKNQNLKPFFPRNYFLVLILELYYVNKNQNFIKIFLKSGIRINAFSLLTFVFDLLEKASKKGFRDLCMLIPSIQPLVVRTGNAKKKKYSKKLGDKPNKQN